MINSKDFNAKFIANGHMPDLAHIIRSVQRLEGNSVCFGSVYKNCERRDCPWLEYCLEEAKKGTDNK